ncbi:MULTISPECIES: pyocin knob domain-containing protein [unclassified Mameliella]|uniref:pyocin knob domain-containing protein n=1 Tax=Mameliella sp. LZ-28 TaxID=2484146 RepID=UPI00143F9E96|nr:pyocin knob domain-containing protein [Mameliella sp. LZ-28]MCR9274396.1 pyocin knob domain-containing protein [Paracoccaceae bacterium]
MATWLRTGTASVTNGNATVTFTGADVIAASIRTGDAFHAPDGRVYEIDTIDSATQVTLAQTYLGSTASGQSYAIQPTRGVVTDLYNSVQTLISSVNGYVSGVLAGLFPAGTAVTPSIAKSGDTDTGLFWPAANQLAAATGGVKRWLLSSTAFQVDVPITGTAVTQSATDATTGRLLKVGDFGLGSSIVEAIPAGYSDIDAADIPNGDYWIGAAATGDKPTSIGFLKVKRRYTGSRVTQEWRGDNSSTVYRRFYLSGVWTPWAYAFDSANAVGTVSQSGGAPTGAIVERGSNANGEYVRFADGTQICTHVFAISANPTTWTFPAAFSAGPTMMANAFNAAARTVTIGSRTSTTVQFNVFDASGSAASASVAVVAIGHWY